MLITQQGQLGEFGELHVQEFGREVSYPTYTCGHCSTIVIMNPGRVRPRQKCLYCAKMVCDNELCSPSKVGCTPLPALAGDRFEGTGQQLGARIRAIMHGATTIEDVSKLSGGF